MLVYCLFQYAKGEIAIPGFAKCYAAITQHDGKDSRLAGVP